MQLQLTAEAEAHLWVLLVSARVVLGLGGKHRSLCCADGLENASC